MKFSLLKIRIRHIFILSLLLLTVETTVSTVYNYFNIRNTSIQTAETLAHYILRARLAVLYTANQPSAVFQQRFGVLQASFADTPHIDLYMSSENPSDSVILPADTPLPSTAIFLTLVSQLFQQHQLRLATYLPQQNTWITFTTYYSTIGYWEEAIIDLFYNIVVIGILWLSFFLYCRYTLPAEVLSGIKDKNSEDKSPNRIIQALKQQIQSYLDEKNLMLGALAHDIRTPLTEALLRLELLPDQTAAGSIRKSLNKITQIVNSSLEYAKESRRIKTIQVDIVSLLELLIENYKDSGFEITLTTNVEQCDIDIELELFKRMIINLLENAKKYATHCQIILQKTDHQLQLEFTDNGPGVPDKFLKLLGIPYFRIDQARSSNTGGSGLGLAIVKKIVDLHQGAVSFNNVDHGGLKVVITFDLLKLQEAANNVKPI